MPFVRKSYLKQLEEENDSLRKELEKITAMRADYPGIEPCHSQRCAACKHAIISYRGFFPFECKMLIGCSRNAKCEFFSPLQPLERGRSKDPDA